MIILLLALNFGISWLNCWAVGGMWVEAKALGGFPRLLAWCGATQAAIGFSSVIGAAIGFVLFKLGYLPPKAATGAASLWYLLIIIPAIGTGLVITVHSWIVAFRERSLLSMGTAAWNTFAELHNLYSAVEAVPEALANVGKLFSSDDDEDSGAGLAVVALLLVAVALAGGVILTAALIKRYSGRLPMPARAAA